MRPRTNLLLSSTFVAVAVAACGTELDGAIANFDAPRADAAVIVDPPDLHGLIVVEGPASASLPDWEPTQPPSFGPTGEHDYANGVAHVYAGTTYLTTIAYGEAFSTPEGRYVVAVNDTKVTISVTRNETTRVAVGRIEVSEVEGTFAIYAPAGDFSNGSTILDAKIPTGVGLDVLPGAYSVSVTYQEHTKTFEVSVDGTELVEPDDLRGFLRVDPPQAALPDWQPNPVPSYGPGNAHSYDNSTYHVYAGSMYLGSAALGEPFFAPEGSYVVAINDTKTSMAITAGETNVLEAGRIEVTDVQGTFTVNANAGDFSNGSTVLDATLPTGTGLTVLPGAYDVIVTYQGAITTFPVVVE